MNADDLKNAVNARLKDMGCTDVLFPNPKDDLVVATFNCREITSFVQDLPGWEYSGIHLDPTGNRQYKIDFKRKTSGK